MPDRQYSAGTGYRYGFNGKEQDNEVSGQGNQYDYGFRIYNPRLGRFLSVDPLSKSYPWYTPYQFSGNKPILCIDLDGLEEWVAVFLNGSTRPTTFRYSSALKPLGANQIYKEVINTDRNTSSITIYNINKSASINVAFVPSDALIVKDQQNESIGFMSAYFQDAKFFKNLDKTSENFAAIGADNLEDMVFKGSAYAMEKGVSIDDAIIDFHGTQHMEKRSDNRPHKLDFGSTELQVDANGKSTNYTDRNSQLFQLLGKFRPEGSQTLMGACNADKCVEVLQNISKDMNTTVYGHKSYSYSSDLNKGRFYGGILSKVFNTLFDGNSANQGKYIQVDPNGTITDLGRGVMFSTEKNDAGDIKVTGVSQPIPAVHSEKGRN